LAEVRIFNLQHRPAGELLPIIRPLVGANGGVSALDNRLIVRADPATLAEVEKILTELDIAPHQLVISVRQGNSKEQQARQLDAQGRWSQKGVRIVAETEDGSDRGDRVGIQQVRVLEGQPAIIRVGELLPVPGLINRDGRHGSLWVDNVSYQPVTVGFEVIPHLQGDQFTLELAPHQDSLANQGYRIQQRSITSTVSGHLGQWLEVGGSLSESTRAATGLAYEVESRQRDEYRVWVKVDEIE
jgi:type II secretory pathway component GspD/PulD (secretin)